MSAFRISVRWSNYIINSDKTKNFVYNSPTDAAPQFLYKLPPLNKLKLFTWVKQENNLLLMTDIIKLKPLTIQTTGSLELQSIFCHGHFLTPKSRFKVPASATPNRVDRETVPAQRGLVRECAVTLFQESRAKFRIDFPRTFVIAKGNRLANYVW